jgi:3-phosphoshikimate 1-carboxyvinyltransferase
MRANKDSVLGAIDLFSQNLSSLRDSIEREDGDHMLGVFTRAKLARDRFASVLAEANDTVKPTDSSGPQ